MLSLSEKQSEPWEDVLSNFKKWLTSAFNVFGKHSKLRFLTSFKSLSSLSEIFLENILKSMKAC